MPIADKIVHTCIYSSYDAKNYYKSMAMHLKSVLHVVNIVFLYCFWKQNIKKEMFSSTMEMHSE